MSGAQDTIVAVSSPPGRSWRGLVRLSGPDTHHILTQLLNHSLAGRKLERGLLRLEPDKSFLLPVLACWQPGPGSYTGQDMAEIQCPGNPSLLERLLHRCLTLGARLAEAGEFTFRRFLAGKIDLTQAEGVAATVSAVSDGQLRAAAMLRHGQLGHAAVALVEALATQLALVEAGIDFVDQDDVVPIEPVRLDKNLERIETDLIRLLSNSRSWSTTEALPTVVLVGAPSSGKSTLFNALLGRQRAVISEHPGTTRDLLAEPLMLHDGQGRPMEIMLVDMAGLDSPRHALDHQVQSAVRQTIAHADVIMEIHDHRLLPDGWASLIDSPAVRRRVRTKADLPPSAAEGELAVCAMTGQGLETLRQAVVDALGGIGATVNGELLALTPRHETALRAAAERLRETRQLLQSQGQARAIQQVELIADELRQALDNLASLGGRMTPDEVIGKVFARFCVGK